MKKLLLLGGSAQQVVAIETAKRLGCYTVLCDYLPDNPGQYAADKFYLVSTTDKDAVLEVAKKEGVDGVLAYASDPAAPTAAYVAEKMGLPGSPYRSVDILCNKDKFRAFLAENGFCTPKARGYEDTAPAEKDLKEGVFTFPVIVKPVDSSGSKGVGRIDTAEEISEKLEYAMSFSRGHKIIVEEFVEKFGYQIAGDGLSIDGKLVFRCFANDHFDPKCENPFVPVSASFPYNMPADVQTKIHNEIQRLLTEGRNRLDIHADGIGHINLHTLARDNILAAALARHLIAERDTLCLCGDNNIMLGSFLQQLSGRFFGDLYVAEHDKRCDIEMFINLAQRQLALTAGDGHFVCTRHVKPFLILCHMILIHAISTLSFLPPRR